ncbi:MAG: acyl-CoA thioesterase [Ruminococcus sp.]|nr:acyl-CoA thioesterase [Ruminococcus sp.]
MKSIYHLTVRGYELDSFGHVNNAVYLQYAEAAKWDFFNQTGLLENITADGYFPVILENNLRYMHELKMMDEVAVETTWKCGSSIMEYKHIIRNQTSGQIACKVTGKLVFVNNERIICDVPDFIKKYVECNELENRNI